MAAGRDFKLRGVASCGINRLSDTGSARDRQLETKIDRFFDDVGARNSRDQVRSTCVGPRNHPLGVSK